MSELDALEPRRGCVAKSCATTESVGEGAVVELVSSRPPTSKNETRLPLLARGLGTGSRMSAALTVELPADCVELLSLPGNCQLVLAKGPGCCVGASIAKS